MLLCSDELVQEAALHVVAKHGADLVSKVLMNAGADPNLHNSRRETPLHLAARAGSPHVVKLLLKYGALLNVGDEWGATPLHACGYGQGPCDETFAPGRALCASELLAAGARTGVQTSSGSTPLYFPVDSDLVGVVEAPLAADAGVHASSPSEGEEASRFEQESCLLCTAAEFAGAGMVRTLLRHGFDPNGRDGERAALHHAARMSDNGDTVRAMLAAGARTEARAVQEVHEDMDDRVPCNYYRELSVTPLHVAAMRGEKTIGPLLALLEGKANIHAQTDGGRTALHIACHISHIAAVGLLLRWGADETIRTKGERRPRKQLGSGGVMVSTRMIW